MRDILTDINDIGAALGIRDDEIVEVFYSWHYHPERGNKTEVELRVILPRETYLSLCTQETVAGFRKNMMSHIDMELGKVFVGLYLEI